MSTELVKLSNHLISSSATLWPWRDGFLCLYGRLASMIHTDLDEKRPLWNKVHFSLFSPGVPWIARRSSQSVLKEISPEHPRTDAEAEAPVLWPPDAGKDWRQEEKGATEDQMFGWHHQLNCPKFEQALGDGEGQGSLACCCLWGHKESDTTEQLNWTGAFWPYMVTTFLKSHLSCIIVVFVGSLVC